MHMHMLHKASTRDCTLYLKQQMLPDYLMGVCHKGGSNTLIFDVSHDYENKGLSEKKTMFFLANVMFLIDFHK